MANTKEVLGKLGKSLGKAANFAMKKTASAADKAAKKTDQFVSVQKVKSRMHSYEGQIDDTYASIGELMFSLYESGEPVPENVEDMCDKITSLKRRIEECREEIEEIQRRQ